MSAYKHIETNPIGGGEVKDRYEIVELAGRVTRKFWVLDNEKNKVVSFWSTRGLAEREVEKL